MTDNRIAMVELTVQNDEVRAVDEHHYLLVPSYLLDRKAIRDYRP